MIKPKNIIKCLKKNRIKFFSGVPDSTLKGFITELMSERGVILRESVNEGNAVASAIGYNLTTSKIPLVYMQNSGLSNALNPILTLAEKKPLYSIPMVLLVGWRGTKGVSSALKKKDEPQHSKIGPDTNKILKALKFKTIILSKSAYKKQIKLACNYAEKNSCPVVILVKRRLIEMYEPKMKKTKLKYFRYDFLKILLKIAKKEKSVIVGTTGFSSREMYDIEEKGDKDHSKMFYCVGAMGHASQISAEIASFKKIKNSRVFMIDGDGAALMHLGSIPMIGKYKNINLVHIIINNQVHESTGNHNTSNQSFSFKKMFEISGYKKSFVVKDLESFANVINKNKKGKIGIEVLVKPGTINSLPRQKSPYELKKEIKF